MFALLANSSGVPVTALSNTKVAKVFPYEPGSAGWLHPCSVTLSPTAIEPTEWVVTVRVYVAGKVVPETAQDMLIDTTVAVSTLLFNGVGYGPDRWAFGWVDGLDCWVASSEVTIGREDGF